MSAVIESNMQLTPVERARTALASIETEAKLKELAKASETILTITNPDGREQCHSALMSLVKMRTHINKTRKNACEDAIAFRDAAIAEEKRLVGIISPEEARLAGIRDTWDARIEAEKQARIDAEIARGAEIQRLIDGIRNWPVNAAGKPSALVNQMLQSATDYRIEDEVFQERTEDAKTILIASTAALQGIYQERLTHEAAQLKLEEDRKELVRLKAEEAERQKIAREAQAKADADAQVKRDAEAKIQADARAAQDAIDKANRERNEMALQEIQAIHHQLIIADTGRAPYCKGGDLQSIDWVIDGTEKWEITEERFGALFAMAVKTKENTLAALQAKRVGFIARQENAAETQRLADERADVARQQEALRVSKLPPARKPKHSPGAEAIVDAVSSHFGVDGAVARRWLREIDWEGVPA